VAITLDGLSLTSVEGRTLAADAIDAVNDFENPDRVTPKAVTASVADGTATLTLAPQSVTVLSLQE